MMTTTLMPQWGPRHGPESDDSPRTIVTRNELPTASMGSGHGAGIRAAQRTPGSVIWSEIRRAGVSAGQGSPG